MQQNLLQNCVVELKNSHSCAGYALIYSTHWATHWDESLVILVVIVVILLIGRPGQAKGHRQMQAHENES
jgi:hypothetical protein